MPDNEEMDDKHDGLTEGAEAEAEHEPESLLREIEKDEDDEDEILPPRKSNKMLIAALSLVIFLALFIFFKGEDAPSPDADLDLQPPMTENITPPSEDLFEEVEVAPEPNAGKILIADGEKDAESGQGQEKSIVPIPKEELAFFDPLSDTEEDRAPSQSEEMALVKAETPKPVSVKPAAPKAKPKQKPRVLKTRKMAADVFTIQLGAFKGRSGADKLDDQLRNNGYDSFVLVMPNDVYRVRVGSFKSRKAAKQMAARIKRMENLDSFVTTE
ncbi:hypothetical protein MNBD_NITROSPIRAE01-202 [hydrothermal vent metagenome]|uniref:SPOR domain-containing protein n=1 Tax=hydrothermal vent metagenome TaxID=652676 RepID=A0A3B1CV93_9ZZZZ